MPRDGLTHARGLQSDVERNTQHFLHTTKFSGEMHTTYISPPTPVIQNPAVKNLEKHGILSGEFSYLKPVLTHRARIGCDNQHPLFGAIPCAGICTPLPR
jgi:hypothetical protein